MKIVKVAVSEIDDFDWGSGSCPDKNVHGKSIVPKEKIIEREDINSNASICRAVLTFHLDNGQSFRRVIDMKNSFKSGHFVAESTVIIGSQNEIYKYVVAEHGFINKHNIPVLEILLF